MAQSQREKWIDIAKFAACILIVAGHLLVGLGYADILPSEGLSGYLIRAMYFFHVQLFFFCSGYLHQSRTKTGFTAHFKNVLKKFVDLGVPYVVFTAISFFLKKFFEGSVNNPNNRSLLKMIFIAPDAPYWFLYALFFIFLITPKFRKKRTVGAALAVSVGIYLAYQIFLSTAALPYAVEWTMENLVWFVMGMYVAKAGFMKEKVTFLKVLPWLSFIPCSVVVYVFGIQFPGMELIMGTIGIGMAVTLSAFAARKIFKRGSTAYLVKYTMPIFLMHTMASPAARAVLLKVGITSVPVHLAVGMAAGIILPVIAAYVMGKTVALEFFLYPIKTAKKLKKKA